MFDFIMQQVLGMKWLSELVWQLLLRFGADTGPPFRRKYRFFVHYISINLNV